MRDVLQSTARKFKIYMADSTDPTAGKTGLSSFTVYLAKDSGAENTVSPTITERGHGWYEVTPTTSHRDTLGENAWTFTASGAVDFPYKETVVAVDNQTVRYGASASGDAMALTSGERVTLSAVIEGAMLNEADGQALLAAIQTQVQALFDSGADVPVSTLVTLIRDGILNRILSGNHDTAGTVGKVLQDVVADTGELQTDWANGGRLDLILDSRASQSSVDTIDDLLDTEIPALTVAVADLPTNSELAAALAAADDAVLAAIAALNNLSAEQVNAEVIDVLATDTFGELGAVPSATSSLKDKLTYMFMWFRNKSTQTSSQRRLFADDGSTAVATETVSDDGTTYTKGEAS